MVQLTPEARKSKLTLDFKREDVLCGSLHSIDGIVVPDAVLKVERQDGFLLLIPSQAQFEWTTDSNGTYSIGRLTEGRYALQVATTYKTQVTCKVCGHFPIQNLEKIAPSNSSVVVSPTTSPRYL